MIVADVLELIMATHSHFLNRHRQVPETRKS